MDNNPYRSPNSDSSQPTSTGTIEFREVIGPTFSFRLSSHDVRNEVRKQTQQVIANEIGEQNVVSIQEHAGSFAAFSIVIWYRQDAS
jgi:hypothetical protein